MRTIDRYICREIFSHALLGLGVFTFVLFVPQLVRLMEIVVRHSADAPAVLRLFLWTLPGLLTFTLPISVLVGVLLGLGRLSADSEIIALHALGFGQKRLLFPVGLLSAGAALLTAVMTFWFGPQALGAFRSTEQRLRSTQASFQVQPRVFDERFPRLVLYVHDVDAAATRWRGVLLAESGAENGTRLTLAEEAIVIADREQGKLQLHLREGSIHEYSPTEPDRYSVSTFGHSDIPVAVADLAPAARVRPTVPELSFRDLLQRSATDAEAREAAVEIHRRFAFPAACLVFALLASPFASRPRRGGRAGAFLLTLLLIFGYYLLFVVGVGLARQGTVSPCLGVWGANLAAALLGLLLFPRMEQPGEGIIGRWTEFLTSIRHRWQRESQELASPSRPTASLREPATTAAKPSPPPETLSTAKKSSPVPAGGLALLIDLYLLRQFFSYFLLMLAGFVLLFHTITFFELLDDVARHQVPFLVVLNYFRYLTPWVCYEFLPLAVLVAAVVTFSVLAKTNELVAFKAVGVSMYRLTHPILLAAAGMGALMFALDNSYLPHSNQLQDALRNQIKGRPAKTFFQPRRQWIFGQGARLYNYAFFDPDIALFGGLNVFELDPVTFQLRRRIFASRAIWNDSAGAWELYDGWIRTFEAGVVMGYSQFPTITFPELTEPPSYFLREVKQYHQMNAAELRSYIQELRQAGFDVARFAVQWHRKFAYPLMAPIIVLLGIPVAARARARGLLMGVALAVALGFSYWVIYSLFKAMGSVGQLPPFLAAWAPNLVFAFVGLYFYFKMPT